MPGINELQNMLYKRDQVESLEERIARLRSAMELGAQQLTAMPGSTDIKDRLAEDMAKLEDLEIQLYDKLHAVEIDKIAVEEMIDTLDDARERRILHYRYIDDLAWDKVSEKIHYSISHCFRLHNSAIKKIKHKKQR